MNVLFFVLGGLFVIALLVALYFVSIYNSLVTQRNEHKNAYKQIDVQLKRRYDLIPNLVETTKKFLSHEKETLEAVIWARNQAVSANNNFAKNPSSDNAFENMIGAEAALSGSIGKLFALNESYPELKSDKTIASLMEELKSTENRIAFARQHYNDVVTSYNTGREVFPNNLVSNAFNFSGAHLWELDAVNEARKEVKISFD